MVVKKMKARPVHQCQCAACQQPTTQPIQEVHAQMNFLMSTLDERQRRLYAGLEASKLGHGGDRHIAAITGLDVKTIAKGRQELAQAEASERVRSTGGGQLRVEKKTPRS